MSHKHRDIIDEVEVVILAGSCDFGRCPLASRLPTALWPIAGKPALERLLSQLSHQGIKQAVICSNGRARQLKKSITCVDSMELKFLDELLPAGTAGCIRDAANGDTNTLLVLHAGIISPPNINGLIRTHRASKSELTAALTPDYEDNRPNGQTPEIYICEPAVLEYVPSEGYFDIKEELIPAIVQAGRTVHAVTLPKTTGKFRDRAEYLQAIAKYLDKAGDTNIGLPRTRWHSSNNVWLAGTAKVDSNVQIHGPVVIMDSSSVSEEAMIFGPTIIGRNVSIGKNSLVENSVFWDRSIVGQNCQIRNCVVDYDAVVLNNSTVENEAVICKQTNKLKSLAGTGAAVLKDKANRLYCTRWLCISNKIAKLADWAKAEKLRSGILQWAPIIILAGVFLWSYWPELVELCGIWQRSDEYSSGLLVPFLALYVLWTRRHKIAVIPVRPSLWGLALFVGAQALRYFGLFFMYSSAERLSLVLSIAALTLLLFGWRLFRKLFAVLLFLCLMLPPPQSVHTAVMLPLQNLATMSAVFCLEMIGYVVIREGNIIHLNGITVAVAEACNGLRMVTSFFVIVGLLVLLVRRTWWEKLIILLSGLPISLLCNTMRLTITAVTFTMLSGEKWERAFHSFGGYAMMPLALVIVILELRFLAKLTIISEQT